DLPPSSALPGTAILRSAAHLREGTKRWRGPARHTCPAKKQQRADSRLPLALSWGGSRVREPRFPRGPIHSTAQELCLPSRGSATTVKASMRRTGLAGGRFGASDEFLLGADERPQTLGQEVRVERLLERLVDARAVEAHRAAVIGQQGDENRL